MGILITAAIVIGLAALGETNNEEAKKINERTKTIYLECQEKGKKADALVNSKCENVNNYLAQIGKTGRDFSEQVLSRYLKIIDERYKNHKKYVVEYYSNDDDLIFDKNLNYKSLIQNLETLNGALSPKVSGKKTIAMAAIGAVGISTIVAAIGGKALIPPLFGSSLLGAFPIAASGSYAISGFLNKKKAIEEQQKMLECQAEVDFYLTKAAGFADSLVKLENYLVDSHKLIKDIMDNFCKALYDFENFTNCYLQKTGKRTIDVKKLTDSERWKLYKMYILSQVVYGSLNMPLYTLKGVGLINKNTEKQMKRNHEESAKLLEALRNE